jgi:hypothetical protein
VAPGFNIIQPDAAMKRVFRMPDSEFRHFPSIALTPNDSYHQISWFCRPASGYSSRKDIRGI